MSNKPITIIAIDPGPKQSGVAIFQLPERLVFGAIYPNDQLEMFLSSEMSDMIGMDSVLAIEMVACYGMPVGADTFRTCVQIGRFEKSASMPHKEVYRGDVKLALCGNKRAKDANIRQCIIDMFGGKDKAIGGKKCTKCKGKKWYGREHTPCPKCKETGWENPPGPLYSVKSHAWSALAIALTFAVNEGHISPSSVNPGALCRNSLPSARGCHEESVKALPTLPGLPS